jgi:hypothetical protein
VKNKKTLLFAAIAGLMGALAFANDLTTDEQYKLNNNMGQAAFEVQLGDLLEKTDAVPHTSTVQVEVGTKLQRVARVEWDGGKTTLGAQGYKTLGVSLPKKALVTNSYFEVIRPMVSAASAARVALGCNGNTTANVLMQAASFHSSSVGTVAKTIPTANNGLLPYGYLKVNEECELHARVTAADATQGKLVFFVEYVVTE